MTKNRRQHKDPRKRILREAENKIVKDQEEQSDDITRIGVVWGGILDLDDPVPPTTVAAMLSASELVMATSTYDSETHWIGAAAYAAAGAYNESYEEEHAQDDGKLTVSGITPIGFAPPNQQQGK